MNICSDCKHCVRMEGPESPRYDCDYNILCSAWDGEAIPEMDPVTGVESYVRHNDLGMPTHCSLEEARPRCRSKNPMGECNRFEKTP